MVSPSRHHHHVHLHTTAAHEYAAERHLEARLPLRHQRALQSRHRHDVAARVPSLPCLPWGISLGALLRPALAHDRSHPVRATPSPPGALSWWHSQGMALAIAAELSCSFPPCTPPSSRAPFGALSCPKGPPVQLPGGMCFARVTDTYWHRSVSRLHQETNAVLYAPAGEEDDGETSGVKMGRRPTAALMKDLPRQEPDNEDVQVDMDADL
jgi:hypothetical protein